MSSTMAQQSAVSVEDIFVSNLRSDSDVLGDIAFALAQLYRRSVLLAGLVYLTDITANRMDGPSKTMLRVFREACRAPAFPHVTLLSAKWETLAGSSRVAAAERNEAELRWDGTRASALEVVDRAEELQDRRGRPALTTQVEMVDEGWEVHETTAGRTVLGDLLQQERRFRAQMAELKAEYGRALRRRDGEHAAELERQRAQLEDRARAWWRARSRNSLLQGEIKRLEAQMRDCSLKPSSGSFSQAALKRKHSRLVKAQRALGLFGVVAGLSLTITGGVTANPGLMATGLSIAGGGFTQAAGT
ncbi:hypothetical protein VTK56DRAFT_563 [Thermocarpiscus australiensis]